MLFLLPCQQPFGGTVDEGDAALRVQPHHPRRDGPENRIEKPPAPFDLFGIGQQRLALGLELARHLVEVTAQHGDLVIALFLADMNVQIARSDPLRRAGQAPHRARKALGEPQPQPDRGEDEDHGETDIEQPELEQHPAPIAFALL